MTFENIRRISMLLMHHQNDEAEKLLMQILTETPNNDSAKYYLSLCKTESGKIKEAMQLIEEAIGLCPENADYFHQKAILHSRLNQNQQAYDNIEQAIALNPQDADYWSFKAILLYDDKQYGQALAAADTGLEHDAENSDCMNLRSLALGKLGRTEEAEQTIQNTLGNNPNDPFSFSSKGYLELQKGKSKKALESFREALKINPEYSYAKAGMIEALKSRFFLYRWFYMFYEWLGRQSSGLQWGLIIGIWIVQNISSRIASSNSSLSLVFSFITYFLFTFVLITWIMAPLSNLFLCLNPYGRFALSKQQKITAYVTGILFAIALLAFIGSLFEESLLLLAIYFIFFIIPSNNIVRFSQDISYSKKGIWISAGIIVLGIASLIRFFIGHLDLPFVFIVVFIIYQIYINKLAVSSGIRT
ncbi:MAG: tetratricopeptide repeat protein [Dysgonamonadaceae bacterium]|jgi:tetratricopeptide (TPR) repeat protein|nr:tetratricopeptide repeat protein [Dysgonamonadaceae bacterium]